MKSLLSIILIILTSCNPINMKSFESYTQDGTESFKIVDSEFSHKVENESTYIYLHVTTERQGEDKLYNQPELTIDIKMEKNFSLDELLKIKRVQPLKYSKGKNTFQATLYYMGQHEEALDLELVFLKKDDKFIDIECIIYTEDLTRYDNTQKNTKTIIKSTYKILPDNT